MSKSQTKSHYTKVSSCILCFPNSSATMTFFELMEKFYRHNVQKKQRVGCPLENQQLLWFDPLKFPIIDETLPWMLKKKRWYQMTSDYTFISKNKHCLLVVDVFESSFKCIDPRYQNKTKTVYVAKNKRHAKVFFKSIHLEKFKRVCSELQQRVLNTLKAKKRNEIKIACELFCRNHSNIVERKAKMWANHQKKCSAFAKAHVAKMAWNESKKKCRDVLSRHLLKKKKKQEARSACGRAIALHTVLTMYSFNDNRTFQTKNSKDGKSSKCMLVRKMKKILGEKYVQTLKYVSTHVKRIVAFNMLRKTESKRFIIVKRRLDDDMWKDSKETTTVSCTQKLNKDGKKKLARLRAKQKKYLRGFFLFWRGMAVCAKPSTKWHSCYKNVHASVIQQDKFSSSDLVHFSAIAAICLVNAIFNVNLHNTKPRGCVKSDSRWCMNAVLMESQLITGEMPKFKILDHAGSASFGDALKYAPQNRISTFHAIANVLRYDTAQSSYMCSKSGDYMLHVMRQLYKSVTEASVTYKFHREMEKDRKKNSLNSALDEVKAHKCWPLHLQQWETIAKLCENLKVLITEGVDKFTAELRRTPAYKTKSQSSLEIFIIAQLKFIKSLQQAVKDQIRLEANQQQFLAGCFMLSDLKSFESPVLHRFKQKKSDLLLLNLFLP